MSLGGKSCRRAFLLSVLACAATIALHSRCKAQTRSATLLVLEKSDNSLAIVDPENLKIITRVPAGPDPHEIVASPDGKLAYISNYGGSDSALNTISIVDLVAHKPMPAIHLDALHSPHGLAFAGGKLYFTVETNKAIGRIDPATQTVEWVLGTGQDRTHMIVVANSLERIFTSNVNSGTISIIEQVTAASPGPPPPDLPPPGVPPPNSAGTPTPTYGAPPASARKTWEVTNVPSGRGSEGFDVSPDGKEIWAANAQDDTVTIIDVATKKAAQTFAIAVKHGNRLKFVPDGKRVLVSGVGGGPNSRAPNLVVLDAANHTALKELSLGGGSAGILVQPDAARAYVAVSASNKVAVVDLKTLEVTGQIPVGKGPDGLAWVAAQ